MQDPFRTKAGTVILKIAVLTKEALQNIIEQLPVAGEDETASFGIFQSAGVYQQSFIRANKSGLLLFAKELLKAAQRMDDGRNSESNFSVPIIYDGEWMDETSDTVIHFVQPPLKNVQSVNTQILYKDTVADKLLPFGCILGALLFVAALVVGFWVLIDWIF